MSDKKSVSAIDAIYLILDRIETMDKKVSIIDNNVKLLNNKLSKLNKKIYEDSDKLSSFVNDEGEKELKDNTSAVKKLLLGNVKLFGYIANKRRIPLSDVHVTVFDESSNIVKELSTDKNGYWEVRLPSGRYGVEYKHGKFKPINRTIEIPEGVKSYEVR